MLFCLVFVYLLFSLSDLYDVPQVYAGGDQQGGLIYTRWNLRKYLKLKQAYNFDSFSILYPNGQNILLLRKLQQIQNNLSKFSNDLYHIK